MRRALTRALRRHRPRAIVYSSPQAAMLQPRGRLRGATAVRFDAPAATNRPGLGTGLLHALERRALAACRGCCCRSESSRAPRRARCAWPRRWSRCRSRSTPHPAPTGPREPIAVLYAGNPEKKGLDAGRRGLGAWRRRRTGACVVTGIDAGAGPAASSHGTASASPPASSGPALVPQDRYRAAARVGRRSSCRPRATRTTDSPSSRRWRRRPARDRARVGPLRGARPGARARPTAGRARRLARRRSPTRGGGAGNDRRRARPLRAARAGAARAVLARGAQAAAHGAGAAGLAPPGCRAPGGERAR